MKLTKKQFSALIKELKSYKPARLTVKGSNFSYEVLPCTDFLWALDMNDKDEYELNSYEASKFETSCPLLKHLLDDSITNEILFDNLAPWKTAKVEYDNYNDRINRDINVFMSRLKKKYGDAVDSVLSISYCPRYQDYERLLKKQELFSALAGK